MKTLVLVLVASAALEAGCTKRINQCSIDSDCKDIVYPFCDVDGEYQASGGETNVCTIVPPNCPVDRCGCSPGATTCSVDQLSICNGDGHTTTDEACALGCATSNDRCLTFEPSNGLGAAIIAAANEPALTLNGATINTDTGLVVDTAGVSVQVSSLQIARPSGNIEAFIASSFDLSNVQITGSLAVAFVAPGPISVNGLIQLNGAHGAPGPGAQLTGSCVGLVRGSVGSGAGNATAGAAAHSNLPQFDLAGGSIQVDPITLQGGCNGGGSTDCTLGFGGGAVQLSSLSSITIGTNGIIDAGGGGGGNSSTNTGCGGGSGGRVIIEAPVVTLLGGITANGGAGGSCGMVGESAKPTLEAAHGYSCPAPQAETMVGGDGGTVQSPPTEGQASGGGGGAVGRLSVHTKELTFTPAPSALISAVIDTSPLSIH
jgi:hypothetical protein